MPRRPSKSSIATSVSGQSIFSNISSSSSSIPSSLLDPSLPLPKLIVFDLDYTLWPLWVDTHVTPPLKANDHNTGAIDRYGEEYAFYRDVPSILQLLPHIDHPDGPLRLAIASRTSAPTIARDMLKILHLPSEHDSDKPRKAIDAFDGGMEIYPGSKIKHMEILQKRNGVSFEDILFFDDESRNRETEKLGLTMQLVNTGVSWDEIEKGVNTWRKRRGYGKKG